MTDINRSSVLLTPGNGRNQFDSRASLDTYSIASKGLLINNDTHYSTAVIINNDNNALDWTVLQWNGTDQESEGVYRESDWVLSFLMTHAEFVELYERAFEDGNNTLDNKAVSLRRRTAYNLDGTAVEFTRVTSTDDLAINTYLWEPETQNLTLSSDIRGSDMELNEYGRAIFRDGLTKAAKLEIRDDDSNYAILQVIESVAVNNTDTASSLLVKTAIIEAVGSFLE